MGESSQCALGRLPIDVECDYECDFIAGRSPLPFAPHVSGGAVHSGDRSGSGRPTYTPSQSNSAPPHKVRGPNWTEAEMLVLIAQKRVEWDSRHNCNQPSLAKFVYGTTAWKLVLAGCMSVVGFRARDTDHITNKWDGLIKDYKKLKEYIDGTGSVNWWGLSREEKKQLSKTRKMSLESSETMYAEMEGFVGRRQIFGRATDVVDSDRPASAIARNFGRASSSPRGRGTGGLGSPAGSAATASRSPTSGTPGDDTPGSTGRKRKAVGSDNLVDFVKDFNFEYLARAETQDRDKRAWRSDILAFDTAREARLARKDEEVTSMDKKLYELEVERTKNLGNMTTALLMLASSMDALTRYYLLSFSPSCSIHFMLWLFFNGLPSAFHFACALDSLGGPPSPFGLPTMLYPHSLNPLVEEVGTCHPPPYAQNHSRSSQEVGSPPISGPTSCPCLQAGCCVVHNNSALP